MCLFNPARVHTAVRSLDARRGLIYRIIRMRERRNCATLSVGANRRISLRAVAHPDNPARAGAH